jgi:PPOX class probable F420-dependent enzyme
MSSALLPLNNEEKYVSLVTFRRDGTAVATAVWFAAMGDEFGVITETNVGKVKRVRNNPAVTITVCDIKGGVAPDAETYPATARLVMGADAVRVRKAIAKKYGGTYRLFSMYWSVKSVVYRLRRKNDDDPETAILFRLIN